MLPLLLPLLLLPPLSPLLLLLPLLLLPLPLPAAERQARPPSTVGRN